MTDTNEFSVESQRIPKDYLPHSYGTESEIKFIDGIGKGKFSDSITISRMDILKSYSRALQKKTNWGNIDPKIIYPYINKVIKSEEVSL